MTIKSFIAMAQVGQRTCLITLVKWVGSHWCHAHIYSRGTIQVATDPRIPFINTLMLSVIMMSVVVLRVVVPKLNVRCPCLSRCTIQTAPRSHVFLFTSTRRWVSSWLVSLYWASWCPNWTFDAHVWADVPYKWPQDPTYSYLLAHYAECHHD
jgi:hypothetical protein